MSMQATYTPEDNKLRLYTTSRLDAETYAKVKAAGFKWAPKQDLFVAPMWTPEREDLLIELCGEIDDEDTSLVERAEERAERFEEYSEKRTEDAEAAHAAASSIADGIPLGQPILVGHHSERRARKDAERIRSGIQKAVRMWETAQYWQARAKGALQHAKYKERPDVRARRIKGLEADLRKQQRNREEATTKLKLWSKEGLTLDEARKIANFCDMTVATTEDGCRWSAWDVLRPDEERYSRCPAWTVEQVQAHAQQVYPRYLAVCDRWIAHYEHRLAYERALLAEDGGTAAEQYALEVGGRVLIRGEWVTILKINRVGKRINSVTTTCRYVPVRGVEEIRDYQAPDPEMTATVKAAQKLPPLCNYPGEGFRHITKAEWDKRYKDSKGTRLYKGDAYGPHRIRYMLSSGFKSEPVFVTDDKRKDPPPIPETPPAPVVLPPNTPDLATLERQAAAAQARTQAPAAHEPFDVAATKAALKTELQVMAVPQLFPTPPDLAARMVARADVQPGDRVLEPSAGTGNLLDALARVPLWESNAHSSVLAIEVNRDLALRLAAQRRPRSIVTHTDFLTYDPPQHDCNKWDVVLMNPPFAGKADINHVTHALTFLKPNGRLVAIMSAGVTFRQDRATAAFRALLERYGATIEPLPDDTFKEAGTGVRTVLVSLRLPAAAPTTELTPAPEVEAIEAQLAAQEPPETLCDADPALDTPAEAKDAVETLLAPLGLDVEPRPMVSPCACGSPATHLVRAGWESGATWHAQEATRRDTPRYCARCAQEKVTQYAWYSRNKSA